MNKIIFVSIFYCIYELIFVKRIFLNNFIKLLCKIKIFVDYNFWYLFFKNYLVLVCYFRDFFFFFKNIDLKKKKEFFIN